MVEESEFVSSTAVLINDCPSPIKVVPKDTYIEVTFNVRVINLLKVFVSALGLKGVSKVVDTITLIPIWSC